MTLLGIDLGTTHFKAGLFDRTGQALKIVTLPNQATPGWEGVLRYDPEETWQGVLALLEKLTAWVKDNPEKAGPVQAVGIAGMAETGLLVDARSGAPRTPLIPWFETCAAAQAETLAQRLDLEAYFLKTGLRLGYKNGLVKLLWLQERHPEWLPGGVWLSVPDYVAYRLTGVRATDYTLAERTGAFRIDVRSFDADLCEQLHLPGGLFPPAFPSAYPVGGCLPALATYGLPPGVPVVIAGHDHVCGMFAAAQLAASELRPFAFDSMGTAEALIGEFPERSLGPADFASGFSFGLSVTPGRLYWQGGLSTSGGSQDWLRKLVGPEPLSYTQLDSLLQSRGDAPTGLFFFPYLAGSGSPHANARVRGALWGLSSQHTRADLAQAVLEGCAYEMEWMRRKAEAITRQPLRRVLAAGGGVRNRRWLQIKTDVFNCPVEVLRQEETSLLGAALLAGLGGGVFADLAALKAAVAVHAKDILLPDPKRSAIYRRLFEDGYLKLEPVIQSVNLPAV